MDLNLFKFLQKCNIIKGKCYYLKTNMERWLNKPGMSQLNDILEYLKQGHRINKVVAKEFFNCWVLFARMADIHNMIKDGELKGYKYRSRLVKEHHNATEYWLEPIGKQMELVL